MRVSILCATIAATVVAATSPALGQKVSPADIAAKLSGAWTINKDLSPSVNPGRSGRGRTGGPSYAIAGFAPQRGGGARGGGAPDAPATASDLTPAEIAERNAIRQLEQIAQAITIKATTETVSFVDQRGEQRCALDNKSVAVAMGDAQIQVKCRWDKQVLKQDFATTKSKLTRSWEVDGEDHLLLKLHLEGIGQSPAEAKAVFNRAAPTASLIPSPASRPN